MVSATNTTPKAIDWQLCLQLANDKAELADEMLDMFINETPATIKAINDSFAAKDFEGLHKHIHKLHGATCYCGLPRLKAIVANTETSIKTQQLDQINAQIQDMLDELDRIVSEYKLGDYKN